MSEMTYRDALNLALKEEMRRDPSVITFGEDVALYEGSFKVTRGLLAEFGEDRVRDCPISENTIAGVAVGAAMGGVRPVAELMTINFALLAMDQIVNHMAKMRYMFGGQTVLPMVIRMPSGGGSQLAAQHSQSLETYFMHCPGFRVAYPATPADAKGLLKTAIRDDNPVVFIEGETLYNTTWEVPDGEFLLPIGKGDIKRVGKDITLIAWSKMVWTCMDAAKALAQDGIECEIVDPRTLRPLDVELLVTSVRKTGRAVIVEVGWPVAGYGAEIAYQLQRHCMDSLDAPIERVTSDDVPMPYAKNLEDEVQPQVKDVVAAVRRALYLD